MHFIAGYFLAAAKGKRTRQIQPKDNTTASGFVAFPSALQKEPCLTLQIALDRAGCALLARESMAKVDAEG